MRISGAHVILYSTDAVSDRAFLRDVLGFHSVDAGDGWLIFRLPPSEVAVHPTAGHPGREASAGSDTPAELYLICEDVAAAVESLRASDVPCTEPVDAGWGVLTTLRLPGGTELGLYEPRHPVAYADPE